MSNSNEQFGIRESVNITLRAKSDQTIGSKEFKRGEPVIYFDSAKTSSLEAGSTTVWAQGGRGNARLLAWEGDKSVTFRFEEALLSAQSFAILSGANLVDSARVPMHKTERVIVQSAEVQLGESTEAAQVEVLDLTSYLPKNSQVLSGADKNLLSATGTFKYPQIGIYVMELDEHGVISRKFTVNQSGALTAPPTSGPALSVVAKSKKGEDGKVDVTEKFMLVSGYVDGSKTTALEGSLGLNAGKTYLVDFYTEQPGATMSISAGRFAGNYQIEADTLFKRASDGRDLPAQFIIPNGKIASSFTFNMSSSGDPSTFPFEVEAFPDFTPFNPKCKALCVLNIADEPVGQDDC